MAVKNYGVGVSGYLDPDGYNWETTVYQASKPVLDKELNLVQDVQQLRRLKLQVPSGWITPDALDSSDHAPFYVASTTADELEVTTLHAVVNGWPLTVAFTEDSTNNKIELTAGPAGSGAVRTDLVILEVWRILITGDVADGKSPSGRIWLNGNVKIASADDLTLNLTDDIVDTNVGAETTKRVQIQYRLRVIPNVDLDDHPFGISDPTVLANSVPTLIDPDGSVSVYTYSRSTTDPGLWVAGNGNPANTLGTVDGYMYALPFAAVFRRNLVAFSNSNHNGGVAYPGPSDRPDGLFHDIIAASDLMDLRHATSTSGWDYQEILTKNLNYLLDNQVKTEFTNTVLGGATRGHTLLWADEIGPTDTPGAQLIREFDAIARRFSDRPIVETVVVRYVPADAGEADWEDAVLTIDPTALPIYPYASQNLSSVAPSQITVVDILNQVFLDETNSPSEASYFFGQFEGQDYLPLNLVVSSGGGLGQVPQGSFEITMGDAVDSSLAMYLTLVIQYPGGNDSTGGGLSHTPTDDFGIAESFVNETPANLPVTAPYEFASYEAFSIDQPHRELEITYRTLERTREFYYNDDSNSLGAPAVWVGERMAVVNEVRRVAPNAVTYSGALNISEDGYLLELDPSAGSWGGNALVDEDQLEVDYEAVRPIPNNSIQATIWYETRAPQTIRDDILGTSLTVIPRYISPHMYTIVSGSGSLDEAYPFPQQYVQSPGVYPSSGGTFTGDHELDGTGEVTVANFASNSGFLQLPVMIPAVPNPQTLEFTRTLGDIDAEGRTFFKEVPAGYIPASFAQPLSDPKRHKNVLPILAELSEDSVLGPRGMMVLVLLSRWADFDPDNYVGFDTTLANNYTSVSVYRLKNQPLNFRSY